MRRSSSRSSPSTTATTTRSPASRSTSRSLASAPLLQNIGLVERLRAAWSCSSATDRRASTTRTCPPRLRRLRRPARRAERAARSPQMANAREVRDGPARARHRHPRRHVVRRRRCTTPCNEDVTSTISTRCRRRTRETLATMSQPRSTARVAMSAHERCRRFERRAAGASSRTTRCATSRPARSHLGAAATGVRPLHERGRASWGGAHSTRGLFLDRRGVPRLATTRRTMPTGAILERILAGGRRRSARASASSTTSRAVDNERYGCGTKLPHNVTGLIGVMNGTCSDLRTGLAAGRWSRSTSRCGCSS